MEELTNHQLSFWYKFLIGNESINNALRYHNAFINNAITIVGWSRIFGKNGEGRYQFDTKAMLKEIGLFYLIGPRATFDH